VGLNPQWRWLTSVCLRGFDRNVQQLFTVFPLHQCLQHAVMNEPRQLSISNQHIRVPRRHVFNFAQVPFRCMLVMPMLSMLNFLKCVRKSIDFRKKYLFTSWLRTHNLLNALSIEPYGCGFQWNVAWVFSTSLSSNGCRTQADYRIDSRWQTWSWRMMGLWC